MALSALRVDEANGYVLVSTKVHARAKRTRIDGIVGDRLKVSVNAPPEQGKANCACVELLAHSLDLAPSAVTIHGGYASENKVFRISGITATELRTRLASVIAASGLET
jgi:uncharacterized protein (TIGR00251 family)